MITKECICEKGCHKAPLEQYLIGSRVSEKIPETLKNYHRVYLVCDENTYRVLGKTVEEMLKASGQWSHTFVMKGDVLPNETYLGQVILHAHSPKSESDIFAFSPLPDFLLAVGSGTVNDISRLASYRLNLPYGIAGTAPSMDGYASAGSPFLFDGTKATVKCTTPRYIFADTDVMKEAPFDMLLAGIGDMFGKYAAILDWEMARDYAGEYYCPAIADDVIRATDLCLKNGYDLASRDGRVVANIMEGFMVTGLGMAFTCNSRPASGSEHIVAHAWELESVERGERPDLHGLEVCEGTRLMALIFKRLLGETDDGHLKELIGKYIPYFDEVEMFCEKMKVPTVTRDREKILRGLRRALTLRDRYTVLFYLRDKGLFDEYAVWAADELMKVL